MSAVQISSQGYVRTPGVALNSYDPRHQDGDYIDQSGASSARERRGMDMAVAHAQLMSQLPTSGPMAQFREVIGGLTQPAEMRRPVFEEMRSRMADSMTGPNAIAKATRENARHYQTVAPGVGAPLTMNDMVRNIAKSGAVAKSQLDVGTQTNFASITGGQALGYVSLDTRIARSTVRPDSFTLYQALPKSAAFQVVDYWAAATDTGGPLAGSAYSGFSDVATGSLATDAGIYSMSSVNLKLALDGRSVTTALMAQNSFVDVGVQENANAALTVLASTDWACYWGNPTLWPNQPAGVYNLVPASNIFDYQQFYTNNATLQSWSPAQTLYNMIYEVAALIASWGRYGRITHAFMTPIANGSLQALVTTTLNNIVTTVSREQRIMSGVVVDGDLQGMRTRMGVIQFPLDMTISARDIPAQGQPRSDGSLATVTTVSAPTSVTVTVSGGAVSAAVSAVGSNWGVNSNSYVASSGVYYYAVAGTDANMNESTLTFSAAVSGITATGAYVLTITPPNSTATAFRVFRTGLGGFSGATGSATAVRAIGNIAANGNSAVTFNDLNAVIPGAESIFLLDLREEDGAFDYRFLLPLTKIELFAANLFMPWAVATIAAPRVRIPKFHAVIKNYVPDSPVWNPLGKNA